MFVKLSFFNQIKRQILRSRWFFWSSYKTNMTLWNVMLWKWKLQDCNIWFYMGYKILSIMHSKWKKKQLRKEQRWPTKYNTEVLHLTNFLIRRVIHIQYLTHRTLWSITKPSHVYNSITSWKVCLPSSLWIMF